MSCTYRYPAYSGSAPYKRPAADTPLLRWLHATNTTQYSFAKQLRCEPRSVHLWSTGRVLPSLVYAFKIETLTKGKVPAESWLGTELGRMSWDYGAVDFDALLMKQRKHNAKYKARKKAESSVAAQVTAGG